MWRQKHHRRLIGDVNVDVMIPLPKISAAANVILIIIGVILFQQWLSKSQQVKEKIQEAKQNQEMMVQQKEELQSKIQELDSAKQNLQAKVDSKESVISRLRGEIAQINEEYKKLRASSFRVRTDDDSVENFKRVFDKFAEKIQTVSVEKVKVSPSGKEIRTEVQNIMMPVAYVDHFVRIEEERSKFEKENERLVEIDGLNEEVKQLSQEILKLEEEKAQEFSRGYDIAYEMFEKTNEQYLKTLRSNRNGNIVGMLSSVAMGVAFGINL